ncbi:hypothetical protein BASA81_001300 [Batrachochytrium salamandrivorans]|nr:hypothetical protein BASA81_001300 [Batrachochytrium salamandrivorans]
MNPPRASVFVLGALALGYVVAQNRKRKRFLDTTHSPFTAQSTAEDVTEGMDLFGKTYLVTGSNSGIGLETVRVLTLRGATVVAAGRTEDKVKEAIQSFVGKEGGNGQVIPLACELSSPESVKQFVAKASKYQYDAILCNAGVMMLPELELVHGLEKQFFTNHIGHFMLVTGLLGSLKSDGRVVLVSSSGNDLAPKAGIEFDNLDGSKGYSPMTAYGTSKLANVLMAWALTDKFQGTSKTAISLHPGVIQTNLQRHVSPVFNLLLPYVAPLFFESLKTIPQGAANQVFAAVHPNAKLAKTTHYLVNTQEHQVHPATSKDLANKLWNFSEEVVSKF